MNGVGKRLVLCVALVFLACGAMAATCTWTGSWSSMPSSTTDVIVVSSGGNLVWSNSLPATTASWMQEAGYTGTVTFTTVYGTSGFTNFTVNGDVTLSGGTWTHQTNYSTEAYRLCVSIGGNLLITNATIGADARGYAEEKGPGTYRRAYDGGGYGGIGGGAGYSGASNPKYSDEGGAVYGSIVAPTNLGSGGYTETAYGSCGGGAILLTVAGTTTVAFAGAMSANGQTNVHGCGSGGSAFLTTGWLAGDGAIRANGGAAGSTGGGGGGGRVTLILTGAGADFSSWAGSNTAFGGTGLYPGAAGTVYRRTQAGVDTLIIDNNGIAVKDGITTRMPDAVNLNGFSNVVVHHKGALGIKGDTTVDFGTLNMGAMTNGSTNSYIAFTSDTNVTYPANWVIDGYTVWGDGISKTLTNVTIGNDGVLCHRQNWTSEMFRLNLTVAGNLTVLSNGMISADAKGYCPWQGPGRSVYAIDGGSHGGLAGGGWTDPIYGVPGGATYGTVFAPTHLGSGGNKWLTYEGTYGGGAIQLTVAGTTTVAGVISANGEKITSNGGGSGGSLFLATGWLTGNGSIRANGGDGNGSYGAGGGGRMAIMLTGGGAGFTTWTGSSTVYGGAGGSYPGAAGTLYRATAGTAAGAGTITVDNRNAATNLSSSSLPAFTNSTESLTKSTWVAQNKAKMSLLSDASIWSLTLHTNSYLELAGCTLNTRVLTIANKVYGGGVYTASQLGAEVSDSSGGAGRIRVIGVATVFIVK